MNRATDFDIGPLSWVKGEIDQAIERSVASLRTSAIGEARRHFHQAHGALQIVGLDGLIRLSEEIEAFFAEFEGDPAAATPQMIDAAAHALSAITVYLGDLLAGKPHQPLRLYPAYRDLVAGRGKDVPSPGDLYFPDLAVELPASLEPAVALDESAAPGFYREQRNRYQRGLLRWLRNEAAGLEDMRGAVAAVEGVQSSRQNRAFWWATLAFLDALATDALPQDLPGQRLANRIDKQLKQLVEHGTTGGVPDALVREVLYYVASAAPASEHIREVKNAYSLAGTIPDMGGVDAESAPLPPSLLAMREALSPAKEAWNRIAAGGAAALDPFRKALASLHQAADEFGQADLSGLVDSIGGFASMLSGPSPKVEEKQAIDVATALLLLEGALNNPEALKADFGGQAQAMSARLQAWSRGEAPTGTPDVSLVDGMSQEAQDRQLVVHVVAEIKANLAKIEEVLDAFFRDPAHRERLGTLERPVGQVLGALHMLNEEQAAAVLSDCARRIARFGQPDYEPVQADFERIAGALSGVGFYVDELQHGKGDSVAHLRPVEAGVTAPLVGYEEVVHADAMPVPVPAVPLVEPVGAEAVTGIEEDGVNRELLGIFLDEAVEVLATIEEHLEKSHAAPNDQDILRTIRRGFHTLKGSGRMVGLAVVGEAAWATEQALNFWLEEQRSLTPDLTALIENAHDYFAGAVGCLREGRRCPDGHEIIAMADRVLRGEPLAGHADSSAEPAAPAAPEPLAEALDFSALSSEVPHDEHEAALPALEAGASPAAAELPLPQLDYSLAVEDRSVAAGPPETVEDPVRIGTVELSAALYTIFRDEARSHVEVMRAEARTLARVGIIGEKFLSAAHTLGGIAGTVRIETLGTVGHLLELALTKLAGTPVADADRMTIESTIDTIEKMVAAVERQQMPEPASAALLGQLAALGGAPAAAMESPDSTPRVVAFPVTDEPSGDEESAIGMDVDMTTAERRRRRIDDDIDAQLLPIFLEESEELMPAVGRHLREWRARSDDASIGQALQRVLHTVKGSARMCGAMALGELTHAIETRVENALQMKVLPATLFDEIEASYDRMNALHEILRNPESAPADETLPPVAAATSTVASLQEAAAQPAAAAPAVAETEQAAAARAVLRVRAETVDRLVNEAGEVAIVRSRVEEESRALKGAMTELTENVTRLRSQLREIEIHAESQMQSRQAEAREHDANFDPLEFDRFTRFQELTRMMAESVNDVFTVQQNILTALDQADAALAEQARLNRTLSQNLMRIRMVPFQSVAERLYRIVRQAAKELGKRAVLDIRGGQIELDRSVIERITAPFEHLLRNAVAHGLEEPAKRAAQGKPEAGEIKIDLRQEGNEVVLAISDDGAGVNVERVRAKAIELGLMASADNLSEAEIIDFIFHPGFSTAEAITQLAGRGVGMDVARSEIAALGGRIDTVSEQGKGTRFTIYLPLTLAVTQAVLVRAAGTIYAIPAAMVEQVRQFKQEELAPTRRRGFFTWVGRQYPLRSLPSLLGTAELSATEGQRTSIVFSRSGASLVALEVDEVIGNQEIVVKNAGPLLARITGITGATVLGSGEIVLILNPAALASREASTAAGATPAARIVAPAQASTQPTVMVVDDSLTVRKITERFLIREGYTVVVAKDGIDALEQLQGVTPDVMLVDIEMPRMDGFDLTRNVRIDRRLREVPVIMITSRMADKHRKLAKEVGVNVFLGKPYQEDELLRHIREFVGEKAPLQA